MFTTPPTLVNMQTELIYPGYTGLLPRPLEGIQQRLLGLPGTRMTLGFTFSKDLESATITWDDGQELPLEDVGRFASTGLIHNQTRQGRLQVRDIHGLAMDDPLLIDFELQNDEKPQVMLPRHLKEDMPLLEDGGRLVRLRRAGAGRLRRDAAGAALAEEHGRQPGLGHRSRRSGAADLAGAAQRGRQFRKDVRRADVSGRATKSASTSKPSTIGRRRSSARARAAVAVRLSTGTCPV